MTTDTETVADVVRDFDAMAAECGGLEAATIHAMTARLSAAHAREVGRAVANERARGEHTCHAECGKPLCVMRRRAEAAEAMSSEPGLLRLLVDLRFALGDNGKRMQDELVEYARELAADARRYRWLRDIDAPGWPAVRVPCPCPDSIPRCQIMHTEIRRGEALDAAIDAAIASGGEDRK